MYTLTNFKTKKALKAAVAAYVQAQLVATHDGTELPPQAQPVRYFQPGPFGGNEPQNGTFCCEGPHFPQAHSWYATCTAKDGIIVKVR